MQKWLQPSWVIWLFNFCILPIVCDQSTVYICITHKKHYILFTFSWSRQAQRGFISFNFYRRFAHEKFFSRNMRSVCTSNRSVPASSCHSDHSVSTWLLVAVKCPGITPTPPSWTHKCSALGDNTEHMTATQSRRPGRKTRQVWGELGSGTEKRERWHSSYCRSSGRPAREWSNSLSPCRDSWETLRPSLYGNHTPAAVSRTLPLHLG